MIDYHLIFRLLGTIEGDLVQRLIELLLFTFTTYMLCSEYVRDPRKSLRYLIIGFGALSFEKLFASVIITSVLFGTLGDTTYSVYLPFFDHTLEIVALILLAGAFIFPFYKHIKKTIFFQVGVIGLVFLGAMAALFYEISQGGKGYNALYWSSIVFICMKLVLILYPVYILYGKKYPYAKNIMIAFLVYLIDPLLIFINLVFFSGLSHKLIVASHAFPFIAVALFTRVMYLKVADKAYLKKALAHEKEISALKDSFVSTVSHELRTPLTSMNLYTSLLLDKKMGSLTKKQKDALGIIKGETSRLNGLIKDILDLSKLEAKKVEIKKKEFDVSTFLRDNALYALASEKKIKMVNTVNSFVVPADESKMKQVLINLISNAIKYTDKGSITLSAFSKKDKHYLEIKDTGLGIASEDLKNIFNKFYQVEHYTTRKQGGSGLGLTIAHEIVKAHGGSIEVTSTVGKGSTFTIVLPK